MLKSAMWSALHVPELLSLVLDWVELPTLLACAGTCKLWREIALDHVQFSGEIMLDSLSAGTLALFTARLAHKAARNANMDLLFRFAELTEDAHAALIERVWEVTLPQWHRVCSLQVEVTFVGDANDFATMWAVLTAPAPRLRMLHLDVRSGFFTLPLDLLGKSAPLLRKMRLRGLVLPPASATVPALLNVQELSLLQVEPYVGSLGLLPAHFPRLTYLVLGGSHRAVHVDASELTWLRQLARLETMCTANNSITLSDVSRHLDYDSATYSKLALERFAGADGLRLTAKYDDRFGRSRAQTRTAARRTFNVHQSAPWDPAKGPAPVHCIVAPDVCSRIVRLILKDPHWEHVCRFAGSLDRLESLQVMFRSPELLLERINDTKYQSVVGMSCPVLREIVVLCSHSGVRNVASRYEVEAGALMQYLTAALDGLRWQNIRLQVHGFRLKFDRTRVVAAGAPQVPRTARSAAPTLNLSGLTRSTAFSIARNPPSARTSPSPGADLPATMATQVTEPSRHGHQLST
ncbi:hypothetical protein BKA62DRAFT_707123 [Auriculariales sp. MPI-PUGE-AT-0066]|nr:hypothetical protein BKA62DRAFT_707123 [Auriculariales sp. MPI-PUGE-AT-0066]